jgi:hypothetical protein
MLEVVEAVRYIKTMDSGRNSPVLLEVERKSGETLEVVAKLSSAECGTGGLVREAMASMLAADLKLPVAEPFIVNTGAAFIRSVVNDAVRARFNSGIPAFGCKLVNGMRQCFSAMPLNGSLTIEAGNTFAFDGAILNADRLVTKPNCMTNGSSLLLIDHELSLNVHGRGFLVQDPWTQGALTPMTMGPTEHLFFRRVKSEPLEFHAMLTELAGIVPARVHEYQNALPPQWDVDGLVPGIVSFLKDLISNAVNLSGQIESALA